MTPEIVFQQACETLGIELHHVYAYAEVPQDRNIDELTLNEWLRCCHVLSLNSYFFFEGYDRKFHLSLIQERLQRGERPLSRLTLRSYVLEISSAQP